MRTSRYLLLIALLAGIAPGARSGPEESDVLFQASTLTALSAGVFDGSLTFRELREQGNFGLGTLNGLDGELVAVDGRFYQVNAEGRAALIPDGERTPFAVVKQFRPDRLVTVTQRVDFAGLGQLVDQAIPSRNIPYAVRITGRFASILARSVPRQTPPYPTLARALEQQRTFTFRDVEGTMVGFRMPAAMGSLNVAGYHFHFLTADRTSGGHVLACELQNVTVELDEAREFRMDLPHGESFDRAELGP